MFPNDEDECRYQRATVRDGDDTTACRNTNRNEPCPGARFVVSARTLGRFEFVRSRIARTPDSESFAGASLLCTFLYGLVDIVHNVLGEGTQLRQDFLLLLRGNSLRIAVYATPQIVTFDSLCLSPARKCCPFPVLDDGDGGGIFGQERLNCLSSILRFGVSTTVRDAKRTRSERPVSGGGRANAQLDFREQ